jgi:hypothetical protein
MRIGWPSPVSRTALLLALLSLGGQGAFAQAGRTWVDPPAEPGAAPQVAPAPAAPAPQPPSPGEPPARTAAPPPGVTPREPVSPPAQAAQPRPAPEPALEPPPARQAEQPAQAAPPVRPAPPAVAAQPREPRESRYSRDDAAKSFAISYLNSWSGPNEAVLDSTAEFYAPQVLFHGRTISMRALFNEKRRFVQRWPERDYRPRPESMGVTCNPAGEICTVHAVFDFTAANPERRTRSEGTGALQLIVQFIGEKPIIVAEHSTLLGQERNRD